jgi:LL-diaminopimelate aminotransferase
MIRINENYRKLASSYLFKEVEARVEEFTKRRPDVEVIKLGIGDVTRALPQACVRAFHEAVDEMSREETFRGYGPDPGYEFLRAPIAETDFRARGAEIDADEIFISDGAKSDTANIQELFSGNLRIAIPDPVYPVYVDTNVMAGRTGPFRDGRYGGLIYLDSTEDNGYIPDPPRTRVDLVYLCFPNNPTGVAITRDRLAAWVDYARSAKALILYDAAYEAFIRDESLPHSIFEIPGARDVAVEFRSFSKTAGFTGTRCAFAVIPKSCMAHDEDGGTHSLRSLWMRRVSTKFNGVSYPVQRAAAALYTPQGRKEAAASVDYYLGNAKILRERLVSLGFACAGGDNSPYIWVKTESDSWRFFDELLECAGIVCTPGIGFGRCGEGYVRMNAFNRREKVAEALERISGASERLFAARIPG